MDESMLEAIRERRVRVVVPTPWRWGCWETAFGEREPVEMLERMSLEHLPTMLQFSAGVRRREDHPTRILKVEGELDGYDIAEFLAHAPEDIDFLLQALDESERDKKNTEDYVEASDTAFQRLLKALGLTWQHLGPETTADRVVEHFNSLRAELTAAKTALTDARREQREVDAEIALSFGDACHTDAIAAAIRGEVK